MEISGKRYLHFYQQASSLIGNQTNHRTNMLLPYYSNSCYESDYECICIVINGKIRSVPLNILSGVCNIIYFTSLQIRLETAKALPSNASLILQAMANSLQTGTAEPSRF